MMAVRAVIIDDELKGVDSLRLLLEKFHTDVKVVATTTTAQEGVTLIENYKPDIVFLDIQMPFLNGFELLNKLTHRDFNLIFTTAYAEYAIKALKNNAVDYLLKPIDIDDLNDTISRIKRNSKIEGFKNVDWKPLISETIKKNERIAISTFDGIIYEPYENIVLLEADSNYTRIHLTNGKKHHVPQTLKKFEDELCSNKNQFMRVHNSYIINLNCVKRYLKKGNGQIIMTDDAVINVSRAKKDDFIAWLGI